MDSSWAQNWIHFLATKAGPLLLPKATALPDLGPLFWDHEAVPVPIRKIGPIRTICELRRATRRQHV